MHSSRLRLTRWRDRVSSDRVPACPKHSMTKCATPWSVLSICHMECCKQCSMLVPHTLQSRALRYHVAFATDSVLLT